MPALESPASATHDEASYERLIFFSDAVMAIAITLLAIDIRVPPIEDPALLGQAILNLLPQIAIYAFSFVLVASFWYGHHRLFRLIQGYDDRLLWLNVLFLMGVAFLPVPSAVLGEHGPELPAVLFFAACYVFIGLAELVLWRYAAFQHRLINPDVPPRVIRYISLRLFMPTAVFAVSMVIALVSPLGAMLSWLSVFILFALLERWRRRARERASSPA
jgi:uncharacterized membrane protein